ncbi:MAG TPA: HDOD domain-containing protein [Burkholderiaceae bacterium]|nr:HDOD domain-containing protein [Burkholderiaceae bacterium]
MPNSWLVARRPLIDRCGGIAGWDLQLSARALDRLSRRDTPRVLREAYWFALAQAARDTAAASRRVLLSAPSDALGDRTFLDQLPPATIARADATQAAATPDLPTLAAALRERGLLLAAPADVFPETDYDLVAPRAVRSRGPLPPAIAVDLRNYEEVTAAVRDGVAFCCGNFVLAARRPPAGQVSPLAANAAKILAAVIAERPLAEVADLFKADTGLAHRLLRATRSAALALNRPLGSLLEAVMMLGTRELYRWLSVLLMTADSRSPLATALHETALARGRLLELLAGASPRRDPPEHLFVTGTFSLLDLLLNVPLEVALAMTPLPTAAVEALIGERGPWRPYLEVALALESDLPDRLEAACTTLRVDVDTAVSLAAQARSWAAQTAAQWRQEAPAA